MSVISKFWSKRDGSVSVIGAVFIVGIVVVSAYSVQTSNMYVVKLQAQRTADLSNMAALNTPSPIVASLPSPLAQATALNMAGVNGFDASNATILTTAHTVNGVQTLSTSVSENFKAMFGTLLQSTPSTSIAASSTGSLKSVSVSPCLIALIGAVNISANASVSGSNCNVSANLFAFLFAGSLNVGSVNVGFSSFLEMPFALGATSLTPSLNQFGYNSTITDPLASNAAILAIRSHLSSLSSWPYGSSVPMTPSNPSLASSILNVSTATATFTNTAAYNNLTGSSATWVFTAAGAADPTCAHPTVVAGSTVLTGANTLTFASGCYEFGGAIQVQSGITSFVVLPAATVTFVFKSSITNQGTGTLSFGAATYSVTGTIDNGHGGTMIFGAGKKVIGGLITGGTGSLSFGDGPYYLSNAGAINSTGTISFGNGPFYIGGSILNNLGGTITFGDGPFYFYNLAGLLNGGAGTNTMTLGNGPFYFNGGSITTTANSTTTLGTGNVDFYGIGSLLLNGSKITFGSGGSSSSGSSLMSFYLGSIFLYGGSLDAVGVTIGMNMGGAYLFGAGSVGSGNSPNSSTYGGSGTINWSAPTGAAPTYGAQNVLFVGLGFLSAFNLVQPGGVNDTISGEIYIPSGSLFILGDPVISYSSSGCLSAVAGNIFIGGQSGSSPINIAPCPGVTPIVAGSSSVGSWIQ